MPGHCNDIIGPWHRLAGIDCDLPSEWGSGNPGYRPGHWQLHYEHQGVDLPDRLWYPVEQRTKGRESRLGIEVLVCEGCNWIVSRQGLWREKGRRYRCCGLGEGSG